MKNLEILGQVGMNGIGLNLTSTSISAALNWMPPAPMSKPSQLKALSSPGMTFSAIIRELPMDWPGSISAFSSVSINTTSCGAHWISKSYRGRCPVFRNVKGNARKSDGSMGSFEGRTRTCGHTIMINPAIPIDANKSSRLLAMNGQHYTPEALCFELS